MRRSTLFGILGFFGIAAAATPAVAATNTHGNSVASVRFVENLGARTSAALNETRNASPERRKRLRSILSKAFDIQAIAKAVANRSWDAIGEHARERYATLFGTYLLNNSVRLLDNFEPDGFDVVKVVALDDATAVVTTNVERLGVPIARIDWVVARSRNARHIVDVVLDKVSTVHLYRSEFHSLIRRKGIGGLMAVLEAKTDL